MFLKYSYLIISSSFVFIFRSGDITYFVNKPRSFSSRYNTNKNKSNSKSSLTSVCSLHVLKFVHKKHCSKLLIVAEDIKPILGQFLLMSWVFNLHKWLTSWGSKQNLQYFQGWLLSSAYEFTPTFQDFQCWPHQIFNMFNVDFQSV